MVFGYPGTTNEYLTSYAIEQLQNIENPHKIAIRTAKLNIINDAMESDELLRIKYASKAASVANAWKKWQGETKGLKRFNTIALKQQQEKEFLQWAADKKEYNSLLNQYKELYQKRKDLILAASYLNERVNEVPRSLAGQPIFIKTERFCRKARGSQRATESRS